MENQKNIVISEKEYKRLQEAKKQLQEFILSLGKSMKTKANDEFEKVDAEIWMNQCQRYVKALDMI